MNSFTAIISAFESAEGLGRELGATGLQVRAWKRRDSIPPGYWPAVVRAAQQHRIDGVTLEQMAKLAEQKRPPQKAVA